MRILHIARNTHKKVAFLLHTNFSHVFHNLFNIFVTILACDIICVLRNVIIPGTGEGPRRPLGHLWVQAWTDNDYLNLRAFLRALFDIISSSGRSFSYGLGTLWRPSVRPTVRL